MAGSPAGRVWTEDALEAVEDTMQIRKVDANGDIIFGRGQGTFLSGDQAIAELLRRRIMLWLGEWFLDTTDGVDYPNILATRPAPMQHAGDQLRQRITDTAGVTALNSYTDSFDHQTDTYSAQAKIATENATTLTLAINGSNVQVQ
jgi:hypothetical protein